MHTPILPLYTLFVLASTAVLPLPSTPLRPRIDSSSKSAENTHDKATPRAVNEVEPALVSPHTHFIPMAIPYHLLY